jgi:hypothetical protein
MTFFEKVNLMPSESDTTIALPALNPGERIELSARDGEVEWYLWSTETRCGFANDIIRAALRLTEAIYEVRANGKH